MTGITLVRDRAMRQLLESGTSRKRIAEKFRVTSSYVGLVARTPLDEFPMDINDRSRVGYHAGWQSPLAKAVNMLTGRPDPTLDEVKGWIAQHPYREDREKAFLELDIRRSVFIQFEKFTMKHCDMDPDVSYLKSHAHVNDALSPQTVQVLAERFGIRNVSELRRWYDQHPDPRDRLTVQHIPSDVEDYARREKWTSENAYLADRFPDITIRTSNVLRAYGKLTVKEFSGWFSGLAGQYPEKESRIRHIISSFDNCGDKSANEIEQMGEVLGLVMPA